MEDKDKKASTDAAPGSDPKVDTEAKADPVMEAVQRGINRWMNDHVYNSPISAHTPAMNHLHQVQPELSRLISEELETKS